MSEVIQIKLPRDKMLENIDKIKAKPTIRLGQSNIVEVFKDISKKNHQRS